MIDELHKYSITLLPDENSTLQIVNFANKLARGYKTKFITSSIRDGYNPHLSIYKFQTNPSQKEELINCIKSVEAHEISLVKGLGVSSTKKKGYVYLVIDKDQELMNIHSDIVKNFTNIKKLPLSRFTDNIDNIKQNSVAYAYLKKYASPNIFEYWKPHITLFRLDSDFVPEKLLQTNTHLFPTIMINDIQLYDETVGELISIPV